MKLSKALFLLALGVLWLSGCGKNLPPPIQPPPAAAPTATPIPTPYPYKDSISTLDPWAIGISSDASYLFAALFTGTHVFVTGPYGMAATWTSYNGTAFIDVFSMQVGPGGTVYMLDVGAPSVYEFSSHGDPVTSWSGYGITAFNSPDGLSVAPNGNVYLADMGNSQVEEFTSQGVTLAEWAFPSQPVLTAVSPVSPYDVYVVERNLHVIHEFTADGNPVTQWGSEAASAGVGMGTFAGIEGIAIGPNGNVFVSDGIGTCLSGGGACYDYFVQEFSPHGAFLAQWGSEGSGPNKFGTGGPGNMAFDGNGDLYVADPIGARVEVFGP